MKMILIIDPEAVKNPCEVCDKSVKDGEVLACGLPCTQRKIYHIKLQSLLSQAKPLSWLDEMVKIYNNTWKRIPFSQFIVATPVCNFMQPSCMWWQSIKAKWLTKKLGE